MPRQTPAQLQEAKRRRAEERQEVAERARLEEEQAEARALERERREMERISQERLLQERHGQLESYVGGIYDEVSKLSIKWPTHDASDQTVKHVNRAIRDLKELLADENDPFLDEIEPIVPAGDMPQLRDVTMTLRQVKDALVRMKSRHGRAWQRY